MTILSFLLPSVKPIYPITALILTAILIVTDRDYFKFLVISSTYIILVLLTIYDRPYVPPKISTRVTKVRQRKNITPTVEEPAENLSSDSTDLSLATTSEPNQELHMLNAFTHALNVPMQHIAEAVRQGAEDEEEGSSSKSMLLACSQLLGGLNSVLTTLPAMLNEENNNLLEHDRLLIEDLD